MENVCARLLNEYSYDICLMTHSDVCEAMSFNVRGVEPSNYKIYTNA